MSLLQGFDKMRLVKTGPSLLERIERWVVGWHHQIGIARLRHFRLQVESDMEPEPWTTLEAPMVLLLSDVCDALALNDDERAVVLGRQGEQALAEISKTCPVIQSRTPMNERQTKVLTHVREHGTINLSAYREICSCWSDETLRLDLANLVAWGLLVKRGAKKGTRYTLTE